MRHDVGIVHRDIKPANLLVDARGNVWVADFGLAQFHAQDKLTAVGDLVGTLRYMSPEQSLGDANLMDHRMDVYALGATLYELLTLSRSSRARTRKRSCNKSPMVMHAFHALINPADPSGFGNDRPQGDLQSTAGSLFIGAGPCGRSATIS